MVSPRRETADEFPRMPLSIGPSSVSSATSANSNASERPRARFAFGGTPVLRHYDREQSPHDRYHCDARVLSAIAPADAISFIRRITESFPMTTLPLAFPAFLSPPILDSLRFSPCSFRSRDENEMNSPDPEFVLVCPRISDWEGRWGRISRDPECKGPDSYHRDPLIPLIVKRDTALITLQR